MERDTGIGSETLRIWKRRYGYPRPIKGHKGERLYLLGQVQRLQLIRRLMDQGLRPGKIVPLSGPDLLQLEAGHCTLPRVMNEENIIDSISLLKEHHATKFEARLQKALA